MNYIISNKIYEGYQNTDFDNINNIDNYLFIGDTYITIEEIEILFNSLEDYDNIISPSFTAQSDVYDKMKYDNKCKMKTLSNIMPICFAFKGSQFKEPYFSEEGYLSSSEYLVLQSVQLSYKGVKDNLFNEANKRVQVLTHELKNIISFVVITCEEDAKYLPDLIKTLPFDSELILVNTIKSEKYEITDVVKQGDIIQAKLYYKELDYSLLRNTAKQLATRPIIFSLDSDERVLVSQHNDIKEVAWRLYESSEMGKIVTTVNTNQHRLNETGITNERVLMFKNIENLKWIGRVHETIDECMLKNDLKFSKSHLLVHHVGYDKDSKQLLDKFENRLKIIFDNLDSYRTGREYDILLRECYSIYALKKELNL